MVTAIRSHCLNFARINENLGDHSVYKENRFINKTFFIRWKPFSVVSRSTCTSFKQQDFTKLDHQEMCLPLIALYKRQRRFALACRGVHVAGKTAGQISSLQNCIGVLVTRSVPTTTEVAIKRTVTKGQGRRFKKEERTCSAAVKNFSK